MVDNLNIDLNVFHKYKPSVALVHGYIKQEANSRGYTLAGKGILS